MSFSVSKRRSLAALLLILTTVLSCLCACQPAVSDEGDSQTEYAPETLEEDTRVITDTGSYLSRLNNAFSGISDTTAEQLIYTTDESGVTLTGYAGEDTVVILPSEIDGLPVVAVKSEAFAGSVIHALSIPDTVTRIGKGALKGCNKLTTLRTPLCTGGSEADSAYFGYLFGASSYEINGGSVPASLTTLILTAPLSEIPAYAFYGCNDITALSIPDTVTKIGEFAFASCSSLGCFSASQRLTSLGDYAFESCSALVSAEMPATVTRIGFGAFQGCASLEWLTLPFVGETKEDNTYLGYLFGASAYTFTEGFLPASLIKVTLKEGCTSIPDNAFCFASPLRSVELPASCQTVGRRAFYGCKRLSEADLTHVTTVGDSAFFACISLSEVTLGDGLTALGIQAFYDCISLKEITLPNSLTAIPASCFDGCIALSRVSWGSGLTTIGKNAFRRCDSLFQPDCAPDVDGITVEGGNAAILPPGSH